MNNTALQYDAALTKCRDIYAKKTDDYGTSWRVFRLPSLTDQIFIKAQRIRTLEEANERKIDEGIEGEFIGLVNYCIIALIQADMNGREELDLSKEEALLLYDKTAQQTKDLMLNKNHDYGEAWRDMRVSSYTDIILTKILRIKQIEDNDGSTIISEGVEGNYQDIINYSIFALIKFDEERG